MLCFLHFSFHTSTKMGNYFCLQICIQFFLQLLEYDNEWKTYEQLIYIVTKHRPTEYTSISFNHFCLYELYRCWQEPMETRTNSLYKCDWQKINWGQQKNKLTIVLAKYMLKIITLSILQIFCAELLNNLRKCKRKGYNRD